MPCELHPRSIALHHKLLVKQIGIRPKRGQTDRGHEVAEQKPLQRFAIVPVRANEIAAATMRNPFALHTTACKLFILLSNQAVALGTKAIKNILRNHAFKNEITLFL